MGVDATRIGGAPVGQPAKRAFDALQPRRQATVGDVVDGLEDHGADPFGVRTHRRQRQAAAIAGSVQVPLFVAERLA